MNLRIKIVINNKVLATKIAALKTALQDDLAKKTTKKDFLVLALS